jgi:hypothetical protein
MNNNTKYMKLKLNTIICDLSPTILAPSSRILLEKLIIAQQVNEFPLFMKSVGSISHS